MMCCSPEERTEGVFLHQSICNKKKLIIEITYLKGLGHVLNVMYGMASVVVDSFHILLNRKNREP